ncbi:[NiFe] hydrogenase metallocenter assembly protein HypF [hydrothermal vent metagenome]|uniref:Carbamoyl phosphate-converting enzyme HypF n=1 Tax=hydrothermal vent metagenome TaxID=652676 RepID=A0A3B1BBL6_9ZZZZ
MVGERIRVTGIVQGVGFRPTVWRLAHVCGLVGQVWNDGKGVLIHVWGSQSALDSFVLRLRSESPPLARVAVVERTPLDHKPEWPGSFRIVESQQGEVHTDVTADAAVCCQCLSEVLDPANRRYRYPFTNCTHCGPRLSIIKAIPYDRANTSMVDFPMCPQCLAEYNDPANRRFHAQPNACPACGPQVWLEHSDGQRLSDDDVIETAASLIRAGHIVAIKGLGGIHLACDAGNAEAVDALRQRKQRYHKPLALMARDIGMVKYFAELNDAEAQLLNDSTASIVVLDACGEQLAPAVAPGQNSLGFMLPYTPLHHLLMQNMERPIVLTSGNCSDEPQSIDNQDARQRLKQIADYYLLHDRDIINRLDDSVLRVMDGQPRLLRRARGYAPRPILLPDGFPSSAKILAMGGELKNTFCLLQQDRAILSQHIGDLEDVASYRDYQHNLQHYRQLFDFTPSVIAVDRHPSYLSTQWGRAMAAEEDVQLVDVQHHHAHIAACMAEHGMSLESGKVLGVALDGLGLGEDGSLWGGEFLLADYRGFQRLAHFQPIPMLGGAQAMREPWRNTFAHLCASLGWQQVAEDYPRLEIVNFLNDRPLATLQTMQDKGLNSPLASSAGRLFDAVAAALGVCRERAAFEGQAAIELEALAAAHFDAQADFAYGVEQQGDCLSWTPLWSSLLRDLAEEVVPGIIAARFHHGLVNAVVETAASLCHQHKVDTVVLGGGVFQNRLLLQRSSLLLRQEQLRVLSPVTVPANDGGLSLGQAVIALATCH